MNDNTIFWIVAAGLVGLVVAAIVKPKFSDSLGKSDPAVADTFPPDQIPDVQAGPPPLTITETLASPFTSVFGLWHPPAQYAGQITATEQRYGIPRDVLARLLYQESRYREDIIFGAVTSPAGALGIAQFMPATAAEMGIDPLDPGQAIDAAGRYLVTLFRRFGTWSQALAAYNWGQGNVAKKGLALAPVETTNYYTQILGDVNSANGSQLY